MIVGNRYGRLVIQEFSHIKNRNKYWICKCDCGNLNTVRFALLKNSNTKSCGCLQKEFATTHKIKENKSRALPLGIAAQRSLYRIYLRNSKKRNYSFNLLFEDFIKLTSNNCYYCNVEPSQYHYKEDFNGSYVYNGIDRINNEDGYNLENSVSCCKWCNMAKGNRTKDEFLKWIKLIYKNNVK